MELLSVSIIFLWLLFLFFQIYLLHKAVQLAPLLFGRTSRTPVAEDEDRFAGDVELVEFRLRSDVATVVGDVLGRLAARHVAHDFEEIGHGHPFDGDSVADPHFARRFGVGVVHQHPVLADGFGRVAAGLEDAYGPEVFV